MWNLKATETKILEDNQFTQEEVTTFGKEKKKKERKKERKNQLSEKEEFYWNERLNESLFQMKQ